MMDAYEKMWKAIIRPPRAIYTDKDLGPSELNVSGMKVVRTDLEIVGHRGNRL
jgi:hypothetical protein